MDWVFVHSINRLTGFGKCTLLRFEKRLLKLEHRLIFMVGARMHIEKLTSLHPLPS